MRGKLNYCLLALVVLLQAKLLPINGRSLRDDFISGAIVISGDDMTERLKQQNEITAYAQSDERSERLPHLNA